MIRLQPSSLGTHISVPEPDRVIPARRGDELVIRRYGHHLHGRRMTAQRQLLPPCSDIPDPRRLVLAPSDDGLSISKKCRRKNHVRMAGKEVDFLKRVH